MTGVPPPSHTSTSSSLGLEHCIQVLPHPQTRRRVGMAAKEQEPAHGLPSSCFLSWVAGRRARRGALKESLLGHSGNSAHWHCLSPLWHHPATLVDSSQGTAGNILSLTGSKHTPHTPCHGVPGRAQVTVGSSNQCQGEGQLPAPNAPKPALRDTQTCKQGPSTFHDSHQDPEWPLTYIPTGLGRRRRRRCSWWRRRWWRSCCYWWAWLGCLCRDPA